MLIPSRLGRRVIWGWAALSVPVAFLPSYEMIWLIVGIVLMMVFIADGVMLFSGPAVDVARSLPDRFAVGEKGEVQLRIRHSGRRPVVMGLFDGIPADAEAAALPWYGAIPPGIVVKMSYDVTIPHRGESIFGSIHFRILGPMRLLWRKHVVDAHQSVRVYPNYAPVLRLSLLATDHRQDQMGIVRKSRAGSSRDFHQLRDYRQGDSLSQIDWKSTSRRLQLISRDFQEQRNQQVVFLLDCGRRMRSLDGALPHFDHCLNALLMVSYVALRQGDHVAVQSFGGTDRWLPAVKGGHAMATILDHLYDADATTSPSDFVEASERIMMRFRRRALVIVMTNLRGEDADEIIPALRSMQQRHLVMLASLCESTVRHAVDQSVADFSAALRHVAARQYLGERHEVLAHLQAGGIITLDVTADQLAVSLANRYLDIKSTGAL